MSDRSETLAREWLEQHYEGRGWDSADVSSLAALLDRVREEEAASVREQMLAAIPDNVREFYRGEERERIKGIVEEQECKPPMAATTVQEQGFWSAGCVALRSEILRRIGEGK